MAILLTSILESMKCKNRELPSVLLEGVHTLGPVRKLLVAYVLIHYPSVLPTGDDRLQGFEVLSILVPKLDKRVSNEFVFLATEYV